MRVGIADHLGWAIAVTVSAGHDVADRRRIDLVEPGKPNMPIHHEGQLFDLAATEAVVAKVRASALRATSAAFDELAGALPEPILSISLRTWPPGFPTEVAVQRQMAYQARADAVMYRQILAELANARGWSVFLYEAKDVEGQATAKLGARAHDVLYGPRERLGPPWTKDHRTALAAAILAG